MCTPRAAARDVPPKEGKHTDFERVPGLSEAGPEREKNLGAKSLRGRTQHKAPPRFERIRSCKPLAALKACRRKKMQRRGDAKRQKMRTGKDALNGKPGLAPLCL